MTVIYVPTRPVPHAEVRGVAVAEEPRGTVHHLDPRRVPAPVVVHLDAPVADLVLR